MSLENIDELELVGDANNHAIRPEPDLTLLFQLNDRVDWVQHDLFRHFDIFLQLAFFRVVQTKSTERSASENVLVGAQQCQRQHFFAVSTLPKWLFIFVLVKWIKLNILEPQANHLKRHLLWYSKQQQNHQLQQTRRECRWKALNVRG